MAITIGLNARVGVESLNLKAGPGTGATLGTRRYGDREVVTEGPVNGWYRFGAWEGWLRAVTDKGVKALYGPGEALPRRWPAKVEGNGRLKVPPHLSIPHTYRTLHPLDAGFVDPHWNGVTDQMGFLDYDRSESVDGVRYYQVNNGKGYFGGTLWIPCKDGDVRLEIYPNTDQPDCNSLVEPDVTQPPPPDVDPPPVEPPLPPPIGDNLLVNGSFETVPTERWPESHHMSGLQAPGWELEAWGQAANTLLPKQDQPNRIPEILGIQYLVQFPEAHLLFDKTGKWIEKIFAESAPTMAQFGQTVNAPAGAYELAVPIFPDQKTSDGTRPNTSADWYLGTEVAAWMGNLPPDEIPWKDGRQAPIGKYTVLRVAANHIGGPLRVHFAMRGRWGFKQNGWFVDGVTLTRVDAPPPPDEPPPDEPPVGGVDVAEIEAALAEWETATGRAIDRIREALRQ